MQRRLGFNANNHCQQFMLEKTWKCEENWDCYQPKNKKKFPIFEGHKTYSDQLFLCFYLEFHLSDKICRHFFNLLRSRYRCWYVVECPRNHRYPSGSFENTPPWIMDNNY